MFEIIVQPFFLSFFGVAAAKFIYKKVTWGDLIGFPILITMLILFFSGKLVNLSQETLWGLSGLAGYILPQLKNVIKAKVIAKMLIRGYKQASTIKDNVIDAMEEELSKDEE